MTIAANTEPTRGVFINVPLGDWTLFTELTRKFGWQTEIKNPLPEESIETDDSGIIQLSPRMEDAVAKAEQDYEKGMCLSDDVLKQRFAKWL